MASENLDLVRSLYASWQRGDWSSAEWADPEIEFATADGPDPMRVRGVSKLADAWNDFLRSWEGYRVEPEEYRELDGGRILVFIRIAGRGRTSGLDLSEIGAEAANLFDIRDGRVVRLTLYWSRERALADLGEAPTGIEPV